MELEQHPFSPMHVFSQVGTQALMEVGAPVDAGRVRQAARSAYGQESLGFMLHRLHVIPVLKRLQVQEIQALRNPPAAGHGGGGVGALGADADEAEERKSVLFAGSRTAQD